MLLGTQRINDRGHLEIGGCDAVELVERFGTPLYVMDEETIRANCRAYVEAFSTRYPAVQICYAGKAFITAAMCRIVDQEGLGLDVASGGELYTALRAGFPAEKIVFHGNYKSEQELRMALEHDIGLIVADSMWELECLAGLVKETGKEARLLIRCTPGIDPHTHKRIKTGQEDSKFGLGVKNGQALDAIKMVLSTPGLVFKGVHCHIGSQLLHLHSYLEAIKIMTAFMARIRDETGVTPEMLNIGGGLGIRYLPEHHPPSVRDMAEQIVDTLQHRLRRFNLQRPVLGLEPGRSIIGEAGTTLYRVGPVKDVRIKKAPGWRTYAAIDGGMSDNPRPQLYDARYTCMLANRVNGTEPQLVTIAGKHCETDILIWDAEILRPVPGDILAVLSTGAYNHSMASNYNRLPRPAVVLVKNGQADLIVERETYDDLIRQDRIPERLSVK
ncbi:MAG: diaminopimelate decarboxylase [Armatimonadota bacterium]